MPAYNFKRDFADLVEVGAKRQTIRRRRRKRPTRAGDVLYLYKGMRTKACENIGDHWCYAVQPLELRADGLYIDNQLQAPDPADAIAHLDGFDDLYALTDFMIGLYGPLPLDDLRLIKWEHLVISIVDLVYSYKRPLDQLTVQMTIPAGTLGRILAYREHDTLIEFHGFKHPHTVGPLHIRSVYAPDHIWPGRPFERVKTCH